MGSIKLVQQEDLYDLASITKVASGLPILMSLYGHGHLDLDQPISQQNKHLWGGNKKHLTWREVLAHQAGLIPYIPFHQVSRKSNGKYKARTFSNRRSRRYSIAITDDLFLHKRYHKKMKKKITRSPINNAPSYKYSGLFFLILPELLTDWLKQPMHQYLYDHIYAPIGADRLQYRPMERFDLEEIVPTEYDSIWRAKLIHGIAHDEAAALLEGISCNAGLFGESLTGLRVPAQRVMDILGLQGLWSGQTLNMNSYLYFCPIEYIQAESTASYINSL